MLATRPSSRPQPPWVPRNIHQLPFITASAPHQPILRALTAPQPQQSCPCLQHRYLLRSLQFSVQHLPVTHFPPRFPHAGLLPPPFCSAGPTRRRGSSTHLTPRPSLLRSTWAFESLCYESVTLQSDAADHYSDRGYLYPRHPLRPRSLPSRPIGLPGRSAAASLLSPVVNM
jgi:hypothetical protein